MNRDITRRNFLAGSTAAVAASVLSSSQARGAVNERINLGLIGCGGIMNYHVRGLVERRSPVQFSYLCDVDPRQIDRIASSIGDFQKDAPTRTAEYEDILDDPYVNAVIIATPHHWHAPIALRALRAGKDVYLEKPAAHVFNEGRLLVDAARTYGMVFQHGTQMESSKVTKAAGELLASGIIGEVKVAKAWNVQDRGTREVVPDSEPPAGVDYERWLGPAPERPFNVNRFHVNWRVYRDYGNGDIGDDGVHDIDMARWGLGVTTHPERITAHGSSIHLEGDREYPDNMMVAYQYPEGKVLLYEDRLFTPYGMHGFDSGNAFYGTEGYMIFSRRGYFQVYLGPKEKKGPTVPDEIRGNAGRGYDDHMENFLECVRTRNTTNAPAEIAHLTCALVHLGEVAYRTQSVLEFDAEHEVIRNVRDANELLTKSYRAPYGLPEVL